MVMTCGDGGGCGWLSGSVRVRGWETTTQVVTGRVAGARANLGLEGKADETFGETIAARLAAAEAYLRENPRSKALARVRELGVAVFNREAEAVGERRYQLLHAIAAALIRARQDGADRVAFIVHEFRSAGVRGVQVA